MKKKLTKRQKLATSLTNQFPGCPMSDALDWASDIIKSETQSNGRVGSLEEISESQHVVEDELGEAVRLRARAKAGLRTFVPSGNDEFRLRIQHKGGVKI